MDPITAFTENCIYEDPDGIVPKDDLWYAYREYCRINGHVPLAKNKLSEELKGRIFNLKTTRPTINKKRVVCWGGLSINCWNNYESCQGCQGCQGSFTLSKNRQLKLKRNIKYPDHPDNLDTSLQNKLDEFLKFLGDIEKVIKGEPVKFSVFITELVEQGWKKSDVKRVHDILVRDGMIFSPRPGFIKRCSP